MFFGWNVGCILALKAALVCSVSSVVCISPPFDALSDESKNDFTQINASILFITGEQQYSKQIDHYRQRLKCRNGLIELGHSDDRLFMSEVGKYRFRVTQQLIDKLIMEEILDFLTVSSPRANRTISEEIDEETKRKKIDRISTATQISYQEDSEDPFLYTGTNTNESTSITLTIPPEQDPNSILLNTPVPSTTTTRKRKGSNLTNSREHTTSRAKPKDPTNPTGSKRGRHRTKNILPPPQDISKAPVVAKRPPKTTTAKQKKQTLPTSFPPLPPPPLPPPSTPSATTSILNTLLQLPSNQPKQRTTESTLLKPIHQPPSFVNTVLSSNSFHQQ